MNWDEKLQKIIDYIENHLQRKEEPVDMDEIVRIAGCSYDFFLKVFSYMNGISLAEYIRFRKMTLAGYDLKSSDIKVVDLSYKYGYDSPTSFTKAFQQFHGISPKEARNVEVNLQVFPKMQVTGKQEYSWRIESKPEMRLIGKSIRISCRDNLQAVKIPEFWNECQRNGIYARLIAMDTGMPEGVMGVFGSFDDKTYEMEYSIMVTAEGEVPEGFCEIRIPEASWAVFDCRGAVPEAIQKGWKYLNEEWLVKYPFKHAPLPEVEWYSDGNTFYNDYLSQIWIPIILEEK